MIIQRCQFKKVESVYDFNICSGQNGRGVYFFVSGDKEMKKYYSKNGENVYQAKIDNKYIKDLSKQKLDYWKIQEIIYNNQEFKAFIFKHKGYNIPTSKEILITDVNILNLL